MFCMESSSYTDCIRTKEMNSTSSCGQADQITFQHLLLASGCFSLFEYNVQIQTAFNTRCQLGLSITTSRQSSNIREN